MQQEKIFPEGVSVDVPQNGPDFVIAKMGFNAELFTAFLEKHKNYRGWINVDILKGKSGKPYAVLNTWKPDNAKTQDSPYPKAAPLSTGEVISDTSIDDNDLPF